jgi:hypothetical protein
VARERRVAQERLEDRVGDAEGDEVVLHLHVDRRLARDERGVAEELALLDHLEALPVALEAHRSLADDVQVLEGPPAGAREPGARGVEHHVRGAGRLLEERRRQRAERRRRPQVGGGVRGRHQKKSVR